MSVLDIALVVFIGLVLVVGMGSLFIYMRKEEENKR